MSQTKKARDRGVRASRAKLTQALVNAGLKTQTSLAQRIAELEGLDNPPKDSVNRVFREKSVDLKTLERIANALQVPAHSLYLTSEDTGFETGGVTQPAIATPETAPEATIESAPVEPSPSEQNVNRSSDESTPQESHQSVNPTTTHQPKHRLLPAFVVIGLLIAVVTIASSYLLKPNAPPPNSEISQPKSIAIVANDENLNAAVAALSDFIPDNIRHVLVNRSLIDTPEMAANIADQFQSDAVLSFSLESLGRYQFSQIYYYYAGEEIQLAAIHHSSDQLKYQPELIAERYRAPVLAALSGTPTTSPVSFAVQKDFLQARQALEQTESELHIKRAQLLLLNLLKQHPEFVLAQAGMCQSKISESWMGNEKQLLEEAEEHCQLAVEALPNHPFVAASLGRLLTRTGRVDEAISTLQQLLTLWPNDTDGLYAMALAKFEAFNLYGNEQQPLLDQAIEHLQLATQLDPSSPNLLTRLGTLYYYNGQLPEMVDTMEQSLKLEDRFLTRFNLNSAYFCVGQPVKALQVALEASSNEEQSYLKDEMLGRGYYFSGNFDKAVEHFQQSIQSVGTGAAGIHHKWGTLADAQRHQGDIPAAIESYRKAITVIKRDDLRGNTDINTKVFYAYYFDMLHTLDAQNYPEKSAPYSPSELETLFDKNSHVSGYFRLAIIFHQHDLPVLSRQALSAVTEECPGYSAHPDYAALVD